MGEKAETLKVRLVDYLSSYSGPVLFFVEVHAMEDAFFIGDKTHSIATTPDCLVHDIFKYRVKDIIPHTRYDVFFGTDLESLVKKQKITSVTLVGVETHTSILFTAESFRNRGYGVTVIEPCCMARDDYMHAGAISIMGSALGVRIGN
jgi:nicotinamidase-related amidase